MNKFENVLIAEDDKDDYLFLVEGLQKISLTYNVARAANGLECITYLKAGNKPDLIFLDLNMPIKNGLDCLKFIKDRDDLKHIPVIIYSTSHYIKDIDCAFKNDAHYYIVKPACADMLVDILQLLINKLDETLERPGKENFVLRITASTEI
jgi:CheY-like chemotaxis protein